MKKEIPFDAKVVREKSAIIVWRFKNILNFLNYKYYFVCNDIILSDCLAIKTFFWAFTSH